MTKLLSDLLETDELQFKRSIANLERVNGYNNQDIRFSEFLLRQIDEKIRLLNLDPRDTTNHELYLALQNKIKEDDELIIAKLRTMAAKHISAEGNIHEGMTYVLNKKFFNLKLFSLKSSKLKTFLLSNPPLRTQKMLHYRSANSMIKHEPIGLILLLAKQSEPKAWLKKYQYWLTTLTCLDFDYKRINVYSLNKPNYKTAINWLEKQHQTVFMSLEMATITILPIDHYFRETAGLTTASLCFSFKYANEIIATSNYLKLNQVSSTFGVKVSTSYNSNSSLLLSIFQQEVSWETFERFFNYIDYRANKLLIEHIDLAEFKGWRQIEAHLADFDTKLAFWQNTDFLVRRANNDHHVSFNILDNALNLCNGRSYNRLSNSYSKKALWQELLIRYFKPETFAEALSMESVPAFSGYSIE